MVEYTNSQVREAIAEHVHSERDRILLCRRWIDGLTIDRLSAEFDLSTSQVKRIIRKNEHIVSRIVQK